MSSVVWCQCPSPAQNWRLYTMTSPMFWSNYTRELVKRTSNVKSDKHLEQVILFPYSTAIFIFTLDKSTHQAMESGKTPTPRIFLKNLMAMGHWRRVRQRNVPTFWATVHWRYKRVGKFCEIFPPKPISFLLQTTSCTKRISCGVCNNIDGGKNRIWLKGVCKINLDEQEYDARYYIHGIKNGKMHFRYGEK